MRYFALSFVAIVLIAVAWNHATLTPSDAATDDSQTVLQISRERFEALGAHDMVTWSRDTSASFHAVDDDGSVVAKADVLASPPSSYPDTAYWESTAVQFVNGVAIVTGKIKEIESYSGGALVTEGVKTEVYAKENGRWVAIRTQSTPLHVNHVHPIASPADLDQYVGKYQWAPHWIENITKRGRTLYSVLGAPPDPLFFVGPDATMVADYISVGTFYRDSHGKVIGYILRFCDGQTIKIPKIQ